MAVEIRRKFYVENRIQLGFANFFLQVYSSELG